MDGKRADLLKEEMILKAVRSSGKGGQHVNKVSTKIEARLNIQNSLAFSETEKEILLHKLGKRVNDEGIFVVTAQEGRSQSANREAAVSKMLALISKALTPVKKRLATKPGVIARKKRLESKKLVSEKKQLRSQSRKPLID